MLSTIRSQQVDEVDDSGAWLSIGDLMSALLMIFALLLISALVQISESQESSKNKRILIIQGINKALSEANIEVEADPVTGDISILDSVLFEQGDYTLKGSGKTFLDKFIPIYSNVVFQSEDIADEVSRIIVEGHSSREGGFSYNMELSVKRASSVSYYIYNMDFDKKQEFFDKTLLAGRGPLDADKNSDNAADRKVMFRFQFKGQELLGSFEQSGLKNVE
ncbi:OmpA/MotB family protein [Pseudoalteromonas undina]|uniref:OmpA/MotB family protein n=1 Tax=Pseudoalteromonas undina TaxID=43660 RepID=UPI001867EE7C|nr:OmpA family protein [Pseudoalteromonas undina]